MNSIEPSFLKLGRCRVYFQWISESYILLIVKFQKPTSNNAHINSIQTPAQAPECGHLSHPCRTLLPVQLVQFVLPIYLGDMMVNTLGIDVQIQAALVVFYFRILKSALKVGIPYKSQQGKPTMQHCSQDGANVTIE